MKNENYHVHSHLAIIRNGEMLAIPKDVGLQGCAYEVHTHDTSGIIHIETATATKFTLGQYFAVWGQSLQANNMAGIVGLPMAVFINDGDTLTEFKGDPSGIELTAKRSITIVLGTVPSQIPSYTWSPAL